MSRPTRTEIDTLKGDLDEALAENRSKYPGMSYEEGVDACLRWMLGEGEHPYNDED